MTSATLFVLSVMAGAVAAAVHALLLQRSVENAVRRQRALPLLVGAPLRMAVPVGVLFGAATLGGASVAGAFLGFVITGLVVRARGLRRPEGKQP